MTNGISWSKFNSFCAIFGIPLISISIWLIVNGTKAVDTLSNLVITVNEVQTTVKDVQADLRTVHIQIDSIQHQQRYNKLEQDYRFQLQQGQRSK